MGVSNCADALFDAHSTPISFTLLYEPALFCGEIARFGEMRVRKKAKNDLLHGSERSRIAPPISKIERLPFCLGIALVGEMCGAGRRYGTGVPRNKAKQRVLKVVQEVKNIVSIATAVSPSNNTEDNDGHSATIQQYAYGHLPYPMGSGQSFVRFLLPSD